MLRDYFYLFIYKFSSLIMRVMPKKVLDLLLRLNAYIIYYLSSKYRNIIFTNLDLAFKNKLSKKQKKAISIDVFYNLLQVLTGIIRRENLSGTELLENIHFENESYLLDALKNNEKIIFITGHYSNWELLPPVLTLKYHITIAGIGRKLDSNLMDKILLKNREKFGVEMIYRKGAIKGAIKALKENKAVGFLLDQNLREKQGGIKVDFFGKPVGHSPAASVLARNFNATMIPVFISTDDYTRYTVTFYPPLETIKTDNKEDDILKMTQAQADITQKVIEQRPHEWFWVHKRWKAYSPELYKKS